jgi:hypothetical protein
LLLHPVPLRIFGGTRRSVDSPPRKGNNRISEASFALARAKCLRRTGSGWNHYCRLHILPDAGGILKTNRLSDTLFTPFISMDYGLFGAGGINPRCGRDSIEISLRNQGMERAPRSRKRASKSPRTHPSITFPSAIRKNAAPEYAIDFPVGAMPKISPR